MKPNLPLVATAASVTALLGAQANAVQVGNDMAYSVDIVITGTLVSGTGTGSGTGLFDEGGATDTLTIDSVTPSLGTIVNNTIIYEGSISGTTFTTSGTSYTTINSCGGNAYLCGLAGVGSTTTVTGAASFDVDILTGGTWSDVVTQAGGAAVIYSDHTLTPVPVPAAAWLFGSALLGLAGIGRKRKLT